MDINDRLYVEIHPLAGSHVPQPHPIEHGRFDPNYVYKVLGMYNPSETSECYFVLANLDRQIWFIPQRHLLAFGLIDSPEMFLPLRLAETMRSGSSPAVEMTNGFKAVEGRQVEFAATASPPTNGHRRNGR